MTWTRPVRGSALVQDGDTLTIAGTRIRLHGVDAPELDQTCLRDGLPWPCGREAAFALAQRVQGRAVSCRGVETDRFGRLVALCMVDGESLNRWLVREGWAVAYRRYTDAYVLDEWIAWWHRRGLWAGSFEPPESWRTRADREAGG
ncbi:MAG: thermonuclease family protein [Acetobacteraceae bacterium]|nr:thermonuclease family protein [Acetobacteraceae bacterium]